MKVCEHCGRSLYLNRGEVSCDGCGSSLPVDERTVAIFYDSALLDGDALKAFDHPGMNIPVNVSSRSRMADVIRISGDGTGALG
jgi:hypothetical protein